MNKDTIEKTIIFVFVLILALILVVWFCNTEVIVIKTK